MTLLDRYLTRQLLSTLLKTLVALVMLFVLVDLLTHRRTEILKHDVPWSVVIRYYVMLTPTVLYEYQVAALAMLISTLLVLGSLAQHNEIIALLAGGVGFRRIVRVPVIVALGLAVAVFVMAETVGTVATRQAQAIEDRFFARNPESDRPGISWAHLPGDWKCHIGKFNRMALTGEDVLMLSYRPEAEERIQAKRIFWDEESQQWLIEDGIWSVFYPERGMEAEHRRITQIAAPIPETPEQLFSLSGSTTTRNALQLRRDIRHAQERGMPIARLAVDFHGKFAKPTLCFVMVWIAIPFAVRLRRGGLAIGVGVGIAVGLAYLILFASAQGLGYIGRLSPITAAWVANVLFMAVGGTLFFRTPT